jgi:hypothetical protein
MSLYHHDVKYRIMQFLLSFILFLFYKTFAWKTGRLGYFDYRFSIIDYNSKVDAHHMAIAKVAFVSFFRYDGE